MKIQRGGSLWSIGACVSALAFVVACGGDDSQPEAAKEPAPATNQAATPKAAPRQQPLNPARQRSGPERTAAAELRDEVAMPSNYPADGPRYPGSWPSRVRQMPDGALNVMFASEDDPAKVATWLQDNLPQSGWTITSTQAVGRGTMIEGDKGGRNLRVITSSLMGEDRKPVTMIAVVVAP